MNALTPLLEILNNPDNPAFAQALAKLESINVKELNRAEIPALLAQLEHTINTLATAKGETEGQLEKLRRQAQAAKSYGAVK